MMYGELLQSEEEKGQQMSGDEVVCVSVCVNEKQGWRGEREREEKGDSLLSGYVY